MDKLKTILTLIAGFLVGFVVLFMIGFLQYLLFFGIICIAVVIALRLLIKPSPPQIDASDPEQELRKVERTLEEYKRKHLLK